MRSYLVDSTAAVILKIVAALLPSALSTICAILLGQESVMYLCTAAGVYIYTCVLCFKHFQSLDM